RGELTVVWENDWFALAYYEHRFPLGPKSLIGPMESTLARSALPDDSDARTELESILSALRHLPERDETAPAIRKERAREKEVVKRRFASVLRETPAIANALRDVIAELNRNVDELDALLGKQSYRLASWKVAAEEINYRRFFDINHLAAV